jgi:signal transduction histidine kinase
MDIPQQPPLASPAPPEPSPDPIARLERAERLLGRLRQVLSHDLSNQLVAVRGLLQVLQLEEGPRLTPDGQDYARRAASAAERAQALVNVLKEVTRLGCERPPPAETVSLADLLREVTAEARKLAPASTFECWLAEDADRAWAPRRLLQQALAHLLRLLPATDGGPRHIGIRSRRRPNGVELSIAEPPDTDRPLDQMPPPDVPGERLDWLLVGELAAACGGALSAWSEPGRGSLLTLVVPAR